MKTFEEKSIIEIAIEYAGIRNKAIEAKKILNQLSTILEKKEEFGLTYNIDQCIETLNDVQSQFNKHNCEYKISKLQRQS